MVQYVVERKWKIIYGILSLFSMLASLTVPLLYYISKRTRQHPASILVCICVFEMMACYHLMIWAMDLFNFLEFFRVYELINYLTFFIDDNQIIDNRVECYQNQLVFFTALYFEFNYNIVLCVDLLITIKKPFISGHQRSKYYHLIVAIVSVALLLFTLPKIDEFCNKYSQNTQVQPELNIAYPAVLFTEILFYIVGSISIFMGIQNYRRICKSENQQFQEVQKQYLINHIFIITALFIIWSVPFANNLKSANFGLEKDTLNNISFCVLLSQGIFLAFIRLREPFFRLRLKTLILSCIGKAKLADIKEVQVQDDQKNIESVDQWNCSLSNLISQYQNRGLVKCILQGVVSITQHDNKSMLYQSLPSADITTQWIKEQKSMVFISDSNSTLLLDQSQYIKKAKMSGDRNEPLMLDIEPNNQYTIKVKEYGPKLFMLLRLYDGIDDEKLVQTLMLSKNQKQIRDSQESMGKSGAFFFFSSNNLLILKTISKSELNTLIKYVLNQYVWHITVNQQSLLSRIYGAYKVHIDGVAPVYLILMENGNKTVLTRGQVSSMYDLKGSLVHREVKRSTLKKKMESGSLEEFKRVIVEKDINFLESDDLFVQLSRQNHEKVMEQLKRDSLFLKQCNLMDYSLLLSISDNYQKSQNDRTHFTCRGIAEEKLYSFCIIDYLQRFNVLKYIEYKYKTLIKSPDKKNLISCVTPLQYEERFNIFINSVICPYINYD